MAHTTSRSYSEPHHHQYSAYPPPWERKNIARIPYMDSSAPSLSQAEREALPALWATRSNSVSQRHPSSKTSQGLGYHFRRQDSALSQESSHSCGVPTPLTAQSPPQAYNISAPMPSGPKSEPHLPSFVKTSPPPPESELLSQTIRSTSTSPRLRQEVEPEPRTTSSYDSAEPSRNPHDLSECCPQRRPSRMQRFKSTIKDIFVHHPVDESNLEHIETRHWTEE